MIKDESLSQVPGFKWMWPEQVVDSDNLHVSRGLVGLFADAAVRNTVTRVMEGEVKLIQPELLEEVYGALSTIRSTEDQITPSDRRVFSVLRDAVYEWFIGADWLIQPDDTTRDYSYEIPKDRRNNLLLLPAQIMNTLTKLAVRDKNMMDADRDVLLDFCYAAYEYGRQYFSLEYFGEISEKVETLSKQEWNAYRSVGYSDDVKPWLNPKKDVGEFLSMAEKIYTVSYGRTINNFQPENEAVGLYFMKSVVIGVMQRWHQQRFGLSEMIPQVSWQYSGDGHSYYNFHSNSSERKADMHTNNFRYPLQKLVADNMIAGSS